MNKESQQYVPVRWKRNWLHPMSISTAKSMVAAGKAMWVPHKIFGTHIRLKKAPANRNLIPKCNTLGYDRGTMFDGLTVSGTRFTVNYQFNNTARIKSKAHIKDGTKKKGAHRTLRRNRLRHRPVRLNNRTGNRMSYTTHYFLQHSKNRIRLLAEAYYCNTVVIEDIAYNHYASNKGGGFSPIEQGKTELYRFVQEDLKLLLIKIKGSETKAKRIQYFGEDLKLANKGERSFYAHCLDSFVLTLFANPNYSLHSVKTVFIDRVRPIKRRDLFQEKAQYKFKKEYYRYAKGGIAVPFDHYSKLKKIRVKQSEAKSNHGPWNYQHTTPAPTVKKFMKAYGGRTIKGTKKSKYWDTSSQWYSYSTRELI